LRRAPARDRLGLRRQLAGAHRADERRVVLEADDALTALAADNRRADRSERLDDTAMHAAMHNAVPLMMFLGDLELAGHFVLGGRENVKTHLLGPPRQLIEKFDHVVAHAGGTYHRGQALRKMLCASWCDPRSLASRSLLPAQIRPMSIDLVGSRKS